MHVGGQTDSKQTNGVRCEQVNLPEDYMGGRCTMFVSSTFLKFEIIPKYKVQYHSCST